MTTEMGLAHEASLRMEGRTEEVIHPSGSCMGARQLHRPLRLRELRTEKMGSRMPP